MKWYILNFDFMYIKFSYNKVYAFEIEYFSKNIKNIIYFIINSQR